MCFGCRRAFKQSGVDMPHGPIPLRAAVLSIIKPFDSNRYGADPVQLAYGRFHEGHDPKKVQHLFDATLDQNRLKIAESYALDVLRVTDLDDAALYREAVAVRESKPAIKYDKHRDHVVHTAHNYLLGWYFFINSAAFRRQFNLACEKRGLVSDNSQDDLNVAFGQTWVFASLLHDVGYLFEGRLPAKVSQKLSTAIYKEIAWLKKYFRKTLFEGMDVNTPSARAAALKLAHLNPPMGPKIDLRTPRSVIQFLNDVGPLSHLAKVVKRDSRGRWACKLPDRADAFEVWEKHYKEFKQPSMAKRITGLKIAFESCALNGLPGKATPVRVLDHGVCGALLLLKHTTFWFAMSFGLKDAPNGKLRGDILAKMNIEPHDSKKGPKYEAPRWWTSVVWATAAAALHNVQQENELLGWRGRLKLSEDPLAYLGILVDILQEWDRHSVHRDTAISSEQEPISNQQVTVELLRSGKIRIHYVGDQTGDLRKKVRKALDASLVDWGKLVELGAQPKAPPRSRSMPAPS
jgi:hypothetical protein